MTPEMAVYFRKIYAGKCPHIFFGGGGICMRKKCIKRRRWIRNYRDARWVPNSMAALRRNYQVLDAIEGIQFWKED